MPRSRWHPEVVTVLGTATATESWLATALLRGHLGPGWFTAIHLAVAVLLMAWHHSYRSRHHALRIGELFILATAVLGPAGQVGTLWCWALYHVAHRRSGGYAAWRRALWGDGSAAPWQTLFETLNGGRETADATPALSFADMIRYGGVDEKHALLMMIARDFRPAYTPALRLALQDPGLRSQAAIAVAHIENHHAKKTYRLTVAAEASPKSLSAWLALARHLDDYAFVGLWDEDHQEQLREQALEAYRHCQRLDPGHTGVATAIGRLLCRSGEVAEAADVLRPVAYGSEGRASCLPWYGECLYRLGRFDELQHLARTARYLPDFRHAAPRPFTVAADLWNDERVSRLTEAAP